MPTFQITSPDGATYQIDGPEGSTEQDALKQVQVTHDYHQQRLAQSQSELDGEKRSNPTVNSSFGQNLVEGAGKTITDIGRGAGQYLGLVSRADVAASRKQDAPLMRTAGGKVGSILGGALVTAPAMAIPGANTVAGAGLVGAAYGALQPSTSTRETLTNTALGGATGAAGQWVGNKISSAVSNRLASRAATAAEQESINSARDAVLKQSQDLGYVVPPTTVNGGATATALESVAGKAAIRQKADVVNQAVTNGLIKQDLGIAANQPITRDAIEQVRSIAGKSTYGEIQKMGTIASDAQFKSDLQGILSAGQDLEKAYPGIGSQVGDKVQGLVKSLSVDTHDSAQALGLFKFLNKQARDGFKSAFASGGNPEALQIAKAQSEAADAVGDLIKRNLEATGRGDLAQQWDAARTLIAKSYQAEAALKGDSINAIQLASQLRKNKPLSDGFKAVAEFADHFGEAARVPKGGVGVSKLGAAVGGGGALYFGATGNLPAAAASLALPAASYATRNALLSKGGQALLATPSYAPSALGTAGLNSLRFLGQKAPVFAIPAANALVQPAQ